jgi:hypothetical protein
VSRHPLLRRPTPRLVPLAVAATAYTALAPEVDRARWTTDEATTALTATECAPCSITAAALVLPEVPADMATEGPQVVNWEGVIGIEGLMTGDGRMIELNALTWELPLPFFFVLEDQGFGHAGKVVIGLILTLERRPNGQLWGTGTIDLGSPHACEGARLIGEGLQPGVSMDLDSVSFEIRVKRELLEEEQQIEDAGPAGAAEDNPVDEEGRVTVIAINDGDEVMVTTGARVRGATSVGVPAFAEAVIALTDDDWRTRLDAAMAAHDDMPGSLVAAAAPVAPPAAWFADPQLEQITPITITPEGRVYGHLAQWGTCHTGRPGQCITPPSSPSNYAYFLTGGLITAEGTEVSVGQITLDTTHAADYASAAQAMEHYSNTGLAVADITVGQDAWGIWFSGGLRPGVTAEQIRTLRASPLSGDWRTFRRGGPLELMAALSVNVQGFPIPRPSGLVASGGMQTLVAAGMVAPSSIAPLMPGLNLDDARYLQRIIDRERATDLAHQEEAAGYARRIEAAALAGRLHAH